MFPAWQDEDNEYGLPVGQEYVEVEVELVSFSAGQQSQVSTSDLTVAGSLA